MAETTYPRPFGAYVLLDHLGRGGMADVELARRTVDDASFVRFVVIKRIQPRHLDDPNFIRMFQDEAKINAELQHENIAQVYDFGQIGEEYFLAMEYVPGVNLRHVQRILSGRGQVPPFRVTFRVLLDVLAALQYAHSRVDTFGRPMRLVHRDVNPRNVMLSVRGEVKLIDFGVAKADIKSEQTVGRSMKGKFAYMAPEQIENTVRVDGRADLYAVGLVLHELIEGRSPFAGLNEAKIINQTLTGPVPHLKVPSLFPDPDMLREVHQKALARSRDERYPDAASMAADLNRAAARVGGAATREEMAEFLRKVDSDEITRLADLLKAYRNFPVSPPRPVEEPEPPPPPPPVTLSSPEPTATASAAPPVAREPSHIRAAVAAGVGAAAVFLAGVVWGVNRDDLQLDEAPRGEVVAVVSPEPHPALNPPLPVVDSGLDTAAVSAIPLEASPPAGAPTEAAAPAAPASVKRPPRAETSSPPASADRVEAPAAPASEARPGFLSVTSAPERGFEVLIDGEKVGVTPLRLHRLPPGEYRVLIRDPATGRSWERAASVEPGGSALVKTSGTN